MIRVLTPREMRAADAAACASSSDVALMRNAGAKIAAYIRATVGGGRIVAFAGPGNNGGDAFAALAELDASYERIIYAAEAPAPSPARVDAVQRAAAAGIIVRALPEADDAAREALAGASLALDGLFGTGSRLPVGARFEPAVRALDRDAVAVLAIDIPSGIDAESGAADGPCVRATATLTLAACKPGLLLEPARAMCGEIWIADIGIDDAILRAHGGTFAAMDDGEFLATLPVRPRDADKRRAGSPLVIAGSTQFPGAAVLCALGAARAGAGYVTVATPEASAAMVRAHLIEQVVVTIGDAEPDAAAAELADVATHNGAVAIGPGLSLDDRTGAIVRAFAARCTLPMVIDASGLFHFGKHLELLRGKPVVLTPHAGEFARLSGKGTIAPGTRIARLREFVERTGITTLLKGPDTLVYNGTVMHINGSGTNALATAGTGDVLTGMISTLLAQGLSPADAARTAAYWHGLAATWCSRERPRGVVAGDLPPALGPTLRSRSSTSADPRRVYA
jgi:NAD(P)H-hydrate epimerase